DAEQHRVQVGRDGDLSYRKRDLAVLDPETRGTPRKIAGDGVEAEAHHLRDQEAARSGGDELAARQGARLHDEIAGGRADRSSAAGGAGRGLEIQLARGVAIEQVGFEASAA